MTEHTWNFRVLASLQQHDVCDQATHVLLQAFPLRTGELVGTDQADADGFGIEPLRMRADLVEMAARGDCAIGVDHEVITDGREITVLPESEFS